MAAPLRIVFHGNTAGAFGTGFADLLAFPADVRIVPEAVTEEADRQAFAAADVIVTPRLDARLPRPLAVRLFQCPGAGHDGIDKDLLPAEASVSNCFEHEGPIAEYIMAAILTAAVPIADADARLKRGEWFPWWAGNSAGMHGEIAGKTLGLVGFGHIGKALAARARPFGMKVHVANRTVPQPGPLVDAACGLDQLPDMLAGADYIVVTLALTPETQGIIGAEAFARMKPDALLINVARGPVVDERALYDALASRRIGGAVIDTWYQYPRPGTSQRQPSALPFETLPNVTMTPHMSGWTRGTIARRRQFIADNIGRLHRGEELLNVVRPGRAP